MATPKGEILPTVPSVIGEGRLIAAAGIGPMQSDHFGEL